MHLLYSSLKRRNFLPSWETLRLVDGKNQCGFLYKIVRNVYNFQIKFKIYMYYIEYNRKTLIA